MLCELNFQSANSKTIAYWEGKSISTCLIISGPWPQVVSALLMTSVDNISQNDSQLLVMGKGKIILNFLFCRKPLIATVEKQLLGEHLTAILQKGNLSSLIKMFLLTALFFSTGI